MFGSLTRSRRIWSGLAGAVVAGSLLPVVLSSPATATPPNIPSKATAQAELNALTVATEGSTTGYSRDKFPHWITISGTCNTRETVLKRDGSGVAVDGSCYPTSGSWYSPYDGATWTNPSDVDIDHVVPLAEAWRSGANTWTTSRCTYSKMWIRSKYHWGLKLQSSEKTALQSMLSTCSS